MKPICQDTHLPDSQPPTCKGAFGEASLHRPQFLPMLHQVDQLWFGNRMPCAWRNKCGMGIQVQTKGKVSSTQSIHLSHATTELQKGNNSFQKVFPNEASRIPPRRGSELPGDVWF